MRLPTEETALVAMEEFCSTWDEKYQMIGKSMALFDISDVIRGKARACSNSREHPWPDFFIIMKCEHEV